MTSAVPFATPSTPLITGKTYSVKSSLLLSLYLFIPVSLLIVGADHLFLDTQFRDDWLPRTPTHLLLWAIVFNFPHIVSSMVTLADKEYLSFYRERFVRGLGIITAVVLCINYAVPLIFSPASAKNVYYVFFFCYATYTVHHVFSQQLGIGMMLMKVPRSTLYNVWRGFATSAGTLLYLNVFGKGILRKVYCGEFDGYDLSQIACGIFVCLTIILGVYLTRQSKARIGTWYIYSNLAMIVTAYGFLLLDYPFFVIALPRFIHDITAFIIYSVHDHNRNAEVKKNRIYRFLSFLPLSPLILCPLLAIALANSIECGAYFLDVSFGFYAKGISECVLQDFYAPRRGTDLPFNMQLGLQILFIVSLFHYYIESFVWHRDSIHRHSVKFET